MWNSEATLIILLQLSLHWDGDIETSFRCTTKIGKSAPDSVEIFFLTGTLNLPCLIVVGYEVSNSLLTFSISIKNSFIRTNFVFLIVPSSAIIAWGVVLCVTRQAKRNPADGQTNSRCPDQYAGYKLGINGKMVRLAIATHRSIKAVVCWAAWLYGPRCLDEIQGRLAAGPLDNFWPYCSLQIRLFIHER